jgi:hypothetical protein
MEISFFEMEMEMEIGLRVEQPVGRGSRELEKRGERRELEKRGEKGREERGGEKGRGERERNNKQKRGDKIF